MASPPLVVLEPGEDTWTDPAADPRRWQVYRVCQGEDCRELRLEPAARPLRLLLVPVVYRGSAPTIDPGALTGWVASSFPVSGIDLEVGAPVELAATAELRADGTGWAHVLLRLGQRWVELGRQPDLWVVGVVDPGYTSGVVGAAYLDDVAAAVSARATRLGEVVAHELGHAIGGAGHEPAATGACQPLMQARLAGPACALRPGEDIFRLLWSGLWRARRPQESGQGLGICNYFAP